jgi:NAD+-dependent protein deacetylase sirtuin 6
MTSAPDSASAAGYSAQLSKHAFKGSLNLAHAPDPPAAVLGKARYVAALLQRHKPAANDPPRVVLHTGAGLSTSAGISDFRGPTGVWTLESRRQPPAPAEVSFALAAPTLAHMAIVALHRARYIAHVVSQNVDALHVRSGLPRSALSELHGNLFVEECQSCKAEFVREYQVDSVGFKPTGRSCLRCGGTLVDKALDWDDALPEPDFQRAVVLSSAAPLNVVVGSSCQMNPARNLPFRGKQSGRRTVLVNLSKTGMDDRFSICCRSKCDVTFAVICRELDVPIPDYVRKVELCLHAELFANTVRSRLWATTNMDETDAIPLLRRVELSLEKYADMTVVCTSKPYRADWTAEKGTSPIGRVVVAKIWFSGRADETDHEELRCRVVAKRDETGDFADGASDTARKIVVAQTVLYGVESAKLMEKLEAEVRVGCKRARGDVAWSPADVEVWFSVGMEKRGYVRCMGCSTEMYVGKKREHVSRCPGIVGLKEEGRKSR